jgi:hypothetical protein
VTDQAAVSLLRWLRRQLRQPTPQREHLEAAIANDDPGEVRRLSSTPLHGCAAPSRRRSDRSLEVAVPAADNERIVRRIFDAFAKRASGRGLRR